MKTANTLWIAVAAFLLIAASAYVLLGHTQHFAIAADHMEESAADMTTDTSAADDLVEKAMAVRAMGDPNAPVTIEEYASLTCSHCAEFYKGTFGELKENFIDTGKVYFIYHDYPLNGPALEAAMVARCLPKARYFQFIKFLFENQDSWAFTGKHKEALKQNAKLLGLGGEAYDACVNNLDLKQALVDKMQKAANDLKIKSTPSFILSNGEMIQGSQPYPVFEKKLNGLMNTNTKTTNNENEEE